MSVRESSPGPDTIRPPALGAGPARKTIAPAWHTCILIAAIIILGISEIPGSRPASPPPALQFYLGAIAFELLLLAYVWWGLKLRGNPLSLLVNFRTLTRCGNDVLLGLAGWAVWYLVESLIARGLTTVGLTNAGAPGAVFPHGFIQASLWILLSALTGFSEELAFRGYLLKQFTAWSGSTTIGIVMQAALFGFGHVYLGTRQVVLIAVSGALLGIFAAQLRNIRPLMLTHAWADVFGGLIVRGIPY